MRLGLVALGVLCGVFATSPGVRAQAPGAAIVERVILDNETVRVSLITFPPGASSGRHVGRDPELGLVVEGELTLVTPEGRETLRAGEARWLPALVPHDARNEGMRPLTLWVILVKK